MSTDAELLQHYARTREAAPFTALVQRHMPLVYRAAWRQLAGDAHAAEDAAQAVFTLFARKAGTLGHHANLAGWLHVTTRHVVRDHLRAARRRAVREQEAVLMNEASGSGAGDAGVDWDRLRPFLDEALGDLREADREALLLRYFQGNSLAAVGAALAVSEEAARMRVNRALDRLREQLARRGVRSTAAALGVTLAGEPALAAPAAGLTASVSAAALAQAAAAGVALAWPWLLMQAVKTAAMGAAAVAAVGWATWEHSGREEILREVDRAEAATAAALRARDHPRRPAVPPASPAVSRAPAPPAAVPPPAPRKTQAERDAEATARGNAFMAAHPEVRELVVEFRRTRIAADAAQFYLERRLTPDQRKAFEEISLQGGGGGMTYGDFNEAGDITFRLPKLLNEKERNERLESALGAENAATFEAFQRSQAWVREVREVIGWAAESGQPMTTEQARALRDIFLTTKPSGPRDAAYWDEVIARAATLLPATQAEALALLKARDELRRADSEVAQAEARARAEKG